jgi:hypothetical protein
MAGTPVRVRFMDANLGSDTDTKSYVLEERNLTAGDRPKEMKKRCLVKASQTKFRTRL